MALDALTAANFVRAAEGLQQVYAYWRLDGQVTRAQLAMDAANWYYQQIGLPFYYPGDLPGYVPSPTSPSAYAAAVNALPLPGSTSAGSGGSGSAGSSGSASGGDLQTKAIANLASGYFPSGALADYCSYYPDDPICYGGDGFSDGGGDGGGGTVYVDQPVTIIINQQGLTLADVGSKISGALASAAAAIINILDRALAAAIAGIQHAINAIGNELMSVFGFLSRLAGYVLSFLKGLLLDVIHGIVAALSAIGRMLKDVFTKGLLPALHALQQFRDYLIKLYERFFRPLLIVLQDARRILAILRVFHIGFAAKLDGVLADIQAKISAPLLYLMKWTNTVANYINLILDARLLIQKPLWLATFKQHAGSTLTLGLNAMTGKPDTATLAALQATPAIGTPAQSASALNQLLTNGSGDIAALVQQQRAQLDLYLSQGVQ